jgi:hypothetical protein
MACNGTGVSAMIEVSVPVVLIKIFSSRELPKPAYLLQPPLQKLVLAMIRLIPEVG